MKVLVTYFSQSGNTEKIAKAICEEAAQANEAELKKLQDITPEGVAEYDVIFIGSPLHSGSLAAPVKECLGVLKTSSVQKMAGFITHMAPAYPDQDMEAFTEPIKAACKDKGIEYKGCFDCKGLGFGWRRIILYMPTGSRGREILKEPRSNSCFGLVAAARFCPGW